MLNQCWLWFGSEVSVLLTSPSPFLLQKCVQNRQAVRTAQLIPRKSNHPNVSPLSDLLPWGEMWLPEVRQLLQCPTPDTLLAINMDNWVFSSHLANSALFSDSTSSLHLLRWQNMLQLQICHIISKLYMQIHVHMTKMLHTQTCWWLLIIKRGRFLSAAYRSAGAVCCLV